MNNSSTLAAPGRAPQTRNAGLAEQADIRSGSRTVLPQVDTAPKSLQVDVRTYGSKEWTSCHVRLATRPEAEGHASDLTRCWLEVEEWRIIESQDPVNYRFENGGLVRLASQPPGGLG